MQQIRILLFLIVNSLSLISFAQQKPAFWDDVQTIKHYDKMYTPPAHPILFTGSSSIRKWNALERTFAANVAMNRGIGGAKVNDITFYANDIIFPYHPRQLVIYVGENDLIDEKATADTILNRTKRLFQVIRAQLPGIPIVYISMKPSPSREKHLPKAIAANNLIRQFLATDKHTVYVDIFHLMLTPAGKLRPELFVEDMLHMNLQGYEIWRKAVEGHLLKDN